MKRSVDFMEAEGFDKEASCNLRYVLEEALRLFQDTINEVIIIVDGEPFPFNPLCFSPSHKMSDWLG